ncbi:MAG TPA: hypothetical protein VMH31_14725 [Methylomirabilota bacterium]|nr:hypothetical protein [Methylomirabilota bacterium]
MARTKSWVMMGVLGAALWATGCGNAQKEATEAAINAAQTAINTVQADAVKYVPDQVAAANSALQMAKDALAKGDYTAALAAAKDAASKARELAASAAAKKQEWMQTWTSLNESLPKSMDAVKAKLEAYSRHLPAGMDKDKLAEAKTQYEQAKQTWGDATAAATQGNLGEAIKKSSVLKELLAQLKEFLGIKS